MLVVKIRSSDGATVRHEVTKPGVNNREYMAFVSYTLCEDTTVTYVLHRSYCMAQNCGMWRWSPASDLMHSIIGAFGTFCKFPSLRMSLTRKFASVPLNLLSPRRSRPGVWGSSATRPFGFRRGPHAGPQRWHRRPAEGVEATSRSSSTNMAAHDRERLQTTEPGVVVCQAQSI